MYIQTGRLARQVPFYIYRKGIDRIYLDTETSGLDPYNSDLILLQIYTPDKAFIININKIKYEKDFRRYFYALRHLMEDPAILKVFQNGKFDIKFLKTHLFKRETEFNRLYDTYIAEKIITAGISQPGECSLEYLARKYAGIELSKDLQKSFRPDVELTCHQLQYALLDAQVLETIHHNQREIIINEGLVPTAKLEFEIIGVIADIELAGMAIDLNKLEKLKGSLSKRLCELESQLYDSIKNRKVKGHVQLYLFGEPPPPNYNSPKQVKKILEELGFSVSSTATSTLKKINHPFPRLLIEYRKLSKLFTSFANSLPAHINQKTKRIHQNIFQIGTQTGRTSSSNPNLRKR